MANEILDYSSKPKPAGAQAIRVFFGLAIFMIVYWFLSGIANWPFGGLSLILSLALLLIVTVLRFLLKKKRRPHNYFYTLGKLLLIPAIYVNIMSLGDPTYMVWGAFGAFGLGLGSLYFRK